MKRIAIYIPTLKSGGAEKQALILACILSKANEVHLITFNSCEIDKQQHLELLEQTSVVRHCISGSVFSKAKGLTAILTENKIEILFNYLTYPDVLGSYVGKKTGVTKIYNGIRNFHLPWLKFIFERFVHNHFVSATIFNCFSGAEDFKKRGFDANKCIVIPNCYPNISPVIKRQDKAIKTIITVGRFVRQKDYLTAIKAIAKMKSRHDFNYHIVGYGQLESQIRTWVQEYGISDKTIISINPTNVQKLLQQADIYLSTSLYEGTSNSIMEALDACLPVVCTDVGDNSQLVENDVNGFLHSVGNYNGISNSLKCLLEDATMRNIYGERGNKLLKDNFSIRTFFLRYSALI